MKKNRYCPTRDGLTVRLGSAHISNIAQRKDTKRNTISIQWLEGFACAADRISFDSLRLSGKHQQSPLGCGVGVADQMSLTGTIQRGILTWHGIEEKPTCVRHQQVSEEYCERICMYQWSGKLPKSYKTTCAYASDMV